jgi:RNA polymerase sigma factor (TIGR02999 family)
MGGTVSVSELLIAWGRGEQAALDKLTPQVFSELRKIARSHLYRVKPGHSLQPTALINEVYIRLLGQSKPIQWESRSHFFAMAAHLMRLILAQQARAQRAAKRGGAVTIVTFDESAVASGGRQPDVLELDQALDRLAAIDERKAKVIELRFFGGMDREEIATALGLTLFTVKRDLRLGEAWLRNFLAGEDCS